MNVNTAIKVAMQYFTVTKSFDIKACECKKSPQIHCLKYLLIRRIVSYGPGDYATCVNIRTCQRICNFGDEVR